MCHTKYSNQKELFLSIWEEEPHVCFVCKKWLGNSAVAHFFAHVLGKGAFPKFKLLRKNIVLLCMQHHQQYDHGSTKDDPLFVELLEKKQQLKEEYFGS